LSDIHQLMRETADNVKSSQGHPLLPRHIPFRATARGEWSPGQLPSFLSEPLTFYFHNGACRCSFIPRASVRARVRTTRRLCSFLRVVHGLEISAYVTMQSVKRERSRRSAKPQHQVAQTRCGVNLKSVCICLCEKCEVDRKWR
jgi:hypothetical protein